MKPKLNLIYFILLFTLAVNAQTTSLASYYKIIEIGTSGGDYTKNLILIHEVFGESLISMNNAVGTITAFRGTAGSFNRINIVEVTTSSAYGDINASIKTSDNNGKWSLKTCVYNGKKYLALDVPYSDAFHDWGYIFAGWTKSTGENMKSVNYEVNGQPVNTDILSNIQDYIPNMNETHQVNNFLILGNNVGIGTTNPTSKLTVAGNIASREVKVSVDAGADFVFEKDYNLPSLESVDKFIKNNKHLPEIASAEEMQKDGINLSEMNIKLLQKIEELTLYTIGQEKKNNKQLDEIKNLKDQIDTLKKQNETLNVILDRLSQLEQKLK